MRQSRRNTRLLVLRMTKTTQKTSMEASILIKSTLLTSTHNHKVPAMLDCTYDHDLKDTASPVSLDGSSTAKEDLEATQKTTMAGASFKKYKSLVECNKAFISWNKGDIKKEPEEKPDKYNPILESCKGIC
jgi:hypothetical protein